MKVDRDQVAGFVGGALLAYGALAMAYRWFNKHGWPEVIACLGRKSLPARRSTRATDAAQT